MLFNFRSIKIKSFEIDVISLWKTFCIEILNHVGIIRGKNCVFNDLLFFHFTIKKLCHEMLNVKLLLLSMYDYNCIYVGELWTLK